MRNIFKKNKGEITSQQIVILIVVIVSFAVLLVFLFRLNLGDTTDEELCHNSVLTRGSAVVPSDAVPLNCHRKYICITGKEGNCEGLTNPERIEVESLSEIYETLADEMANCWWMFGEGRVNYVGDDLTHNNYCSICSQIYFDEGLKSITGEKITKDGLYKFLENNNIDKTNTYAEYLFGGKNLDAIKKESLEKHGVESFGDIEVGKQYFVVMGITSEVGLWNWVGIGAGGGSAIVGAAVVSAIVFGTTPVGWVAGLTVIGLSAGAGGAVGVGIGETIEPEIATIILDGRGIDNKFMAPTIIEANSEKFNALNCEEILTLA
ncbi:MAG: hypothetical protein ABFQ65_04530 [Nanoarchaeota archaeon]